MKLKDLLQRIQDAYLSMELEHPGCLEEKFKDIEQYRDDEILHKMKLEIDSDDQDLVEEQLEGDE